MPKGYLIAHVDVTDPEAYKGYVTANAEAFAKYEGRFLVRGGGNEILEGTSRSRHVVLEFPSYKAAWDCYHSPEYGKAMAIRKPASEGDVVIVEGYDGPQPGE